MAAPAGVTPLSDNVIITVVLSSGIVTNGAKVLTGHVESIGLNVTNCVVGSYVIFVPDVFFSIGNASWQIVPQVNVKGFYTPA